MGRPVQSKISNYTICKYLRKKIFKDFERIKSLKQKTLDLLEEMIGNNDLTPTETRVAIGIIQKISISKNEQLNTSLKLEQLLAPPNASFFFLKIVFNPTRYAILKSIVF